MRPDRQPLWRRAEGGLLLGRSLRDPAGKHGVDRDVDSKCNMHAGLDCILYQAASKARHGIQSHYPYGDPKAGGGAAQTLTYCPGAADIQH